MLIRKTQITTRHRCEGLTALRVGTFVVVLAGLTALTAYGFVRTASNQAVERIIPQAPQPATVVADQPAAQNTRGEVELVMLGPSGFQPERFSRPRGRFLFGINNRTSVSDLTFQVIDETGVVVAEQRVVRVRVWRKVIGPEPGRYLVRVVGHPDWHCGITILPQ